MEKTQTNKKFTLIFAVLILLGGTYGIYKYMHSLAHESTDDAQIEKNIKEDETKENDSKKNRILL